MEKNSYMWIKEGYIGCNLLHSNYKEANHKVIFGGAQQLDEIKWNLSLLYSYMSYNNGKSPGGGYCTTINVVVEANEKVRFESFLGITEDISIKCRPDEHMNCTRFFPIQFIKLIYISKDYIKYEVHCI